MKQGKSVGTCELCGREEVERTVHHLVPKDEGGTHGATAWLCKACHRQIHALYSNKELAVRLNTIEQLRADEKIWRFIKWIRKQRGEKRVKVRKSKTKKR